MKSDNERKSVSPIVAIIILLIITIVVAGTVSFWLSTLTP